MFVIRWVVRVVVGLVALVALLFIVARFHDGPLGPIPGGALVAGTLVREPVTDWSFARDQAEIELQLESQKRARTVWILVHDGQAYIPCSLGFPPGKTWYKEAAKDGRSVVRIAGRRYPVMLTKVDDAVQQQLASPLEAEVRRKYGSPPPTSAGVWFFRVTSR